MVNIRTRIDKLENEAKPGVIVMWRHHAETNDQAKARWQDENPGEDLGPRRHSRHHRPVERSTMSFG